MGSRPINRCLRSHRIARGSIVAPSHRNETGRGMGYVPRTGHDTNVGANSSLRANVIGRRRKSLICKAYLLTLKLNDGEFDAGLKDRTGLLRTAKVASRRAQAANSPREQGQLLPSAQFEPQCPSTLVTTRCPRRGINVTNQCRGVPGVRSPGQWYFSPLP